ncbi:hypothetical protein F2Q69_00005864 [Brassica cretica]|uniref:Uncharacterized protein n=1 Tax=Brassica cretica TaxID=69181 RepID=A0A8S9PGU4_BRACR|nr:hypothetical protein F2Q69_00005864 [Brassica cretica]
MVPKVGYHSYMEDTGVEVSRTGQDQVELAGQADSRDGRTRRQTQPRDDSARRRAEWLSLPGECNHTAVQLAGELTGELTGVMVELAGELTRMTVQLSCEWLCAGFARSFTSDLSFN